MIAGYYDRTGYAVMYIGPTNGGVMPLDNSAWPDWQDSGGDWRHQCPLSATHLGLDGRTITGHVDDYWIVYGNIGPDPFIGSWPEHTYGDCTADYMKTNQSNYGNVDGGTTFYNFNDGSPLHWYEMEGYGIAAEDGGYGLKLFYESRGYAVTEMYNQYIRGYVSPIRGFTYEQYKAEIDAGRPVMIHVQGHTMVGVGYDDTSNLVYLHDTWDYGVHTMVWGDAYAGMQHYAVTIVQLAPLTSPPAAPTDLVATAGAASYSDTGLAAGTTYHYRVYAYNSGGDSDYSNEASATTAEETTPPAPPTNLGATPGDSVVELTWDSSSESDLAGYTVYRATTSGGPYSALTPSLLSAPSYTDSPVTNGTTYYYVVTASDINGNESEYSSEASATPQVQVTNDLARADYATTYGTVAGTYEATHTQDDSDQSIAEQHSGGKPSLRHDQLEHIWTFLVTDGNHILNIDAYYDDAGDGDSGFPFSWSTDPSGPWTDLLTVVKTADDDGYQQADLGSVSGTIYVRAVDNDRTSGENAYDTLHVDHMFIDGGVPPTEPPGPATDPDPAHGVTDVTTTPTLSWTAGAGAELHDVYFGTDPMSLPPVSEGQSETTYAPPELDAGTTYYWRVDEVNSIGATPGAVWSFTTRSSIGPTSVHVHSIVLDTVRSSPPQVSGRATVVVIDDLGDVVGAATVYGRFDGDFSQSLSALSDGSGTAILTTDQAVKKPSYTFCVDNVQVDGLAYDASADAVTCPSYP